MLLHASCVALGDLAVLIAGPPGAGKSDLALRLIDQGARLVADDQTALSVERNRLIAAPPSSIAGLIEVRHVGLLRLPHAEKVPVALYVGLVPLEEKIERLPESAFTELLGHRIRLLRLPAFAASTPSKIRAALAYPPVSEGAETLH